MMKQAIRYFSLGLLLSALLLYGYQFFNKGDETSSLSNEELITLVENEGFHVVSEEEYINFTLNKEKTEVEADENKEKPDTDKNAEKEDTADKDKKKDNKEKEKTSNEKDEPKVLKTKLKVEEGIYTPQIADILIDEKIIDDRKKFIKYMDGNGYSEYIQLGTFNVNSDMTLKELAETLTTYPGN